ncbi:hypothetical protein Btru_043407 [Bulinus truncatus]|nr:hypothetical protein Btru_043407 [Bulinus truncatus]
MADVVSTGSVEQPRNVADVVSTGSVEQPRNVADVVSTGSVEQPRNAADVVSTGSVEQPGNVADVVSTGSVEQPGNVADGIDWFRGTTGKCGRCAVVPTGVFEPTGNVAAVVSTGFVEQPENMAAVVSTGSVEQLENMAAVVSTSFVEHPENMAAVVSTGFVEQPENMAAVVSTSFVAQPGNIASAGSDSVTVDSPEIGIEESHIGNSLPIVSDHVPYIQTSSNRSSNESSKTLTCSDLGIIQERPKFPSYSLKQNRLKSLANWPQTGNVDIERISDAGFYHEGGGQLTCFYCGGGFTKWNDKNDIYVEHARRYGKCAYINQKLGRQFVAAVEELKNIKIRLNLQQPGNMADVVSTGSVEQPRNVADVVSTGSVEQPRNVADVVSTGSVEQPRNAADVVSTGSVEQPGNVADVVSTGSVEQPGNVADVVSTGSVEQPGNVADVVSTGSVEQPGNVADVLSTGVFEPTENVAAVVPTGVFEPTGNVAAVVSTGFVEQPENMAAVVSTGSVEQLENMAAVVSTSFVEHPENMAAVVSTGFVEQPENMAAVVSTSFVAQPGNIASAGSDSVTVDSPEIGIEESHIGNSLPIVSDHVPYIQTSSNRSSNESSKTLTCSDLGIIQERPKFPSYSLKQNRLKSLANWPQTGNVDIERISDAGFYHEGGGQLTCFYCGGGFTKWNDKNDIYVEHARRYGKCAYINQKLGRQFVAAVEELKKYKDKITYKMVTDKMGHFASLIDNKGNRLKRDPAVKVLIESGYQEEEVLNIAHQLTSEDLSADILLERLIQQDNVDHHLVKERWKLSEDTRLSDNQAPDITELKNSNKELREQRMCKICMDSEVHVVFLPCGHLVACTECASALQTCAVCRETIRAVVRAFLT